ncbi:MAG: hypothetical protein JWN86_662 [Planctomycetota bacterium]|nr:hypothetical protein [Planctomycetota bacterium]
MDRRRFTPSAERLDARLLLSSAKRPTNVPAANLQQKTLRIERLPAYLESLQPGRTLPMDTVTAIQNDLRAIVGKLNRPPEETLVAVNLQYRSTISHASLTVEDAAALNATFVRVITDTGMDPVTVQHFKANMTTLAQADSFGPNPALVATNDYALILQTVLGVGRPIRTPAAPRLSPSDDSAPKGDHKTTVTQPHLIGTYDSATTMQLIDENNQVLGQVAVTSTGQYSVAPSSPLSVGTHTLRVRAFDANNDFSAPSNSITITIKAPPIPRQRAH